jgi:hypothetical protein
MVYLHASDAHDQQAPALESEEAERVRESNPHCQLGKSVSLVGPDLRMP